MKKIVFMLEESSAKELLDVLIPKIISLNDFTFLCIVHEGKSHLRKSIQRKLCAWKEPNVQFVILHDKDSSDCLILKKELISLVEKSNRTDTLIRIICTELESWYLGDLEAVEKAFSVDLSKKKIK